MSRSAAREARAVGKHLWLVSEPKRTLLTGAWRSDTDVTGSPLRTVKDRKFLRVRAPKSEWLRHIHRRRLRLGHPTGKGDRGSLRQGPNRLRPRRRLRALRPRPQRRAAHQSFSWVKRIAAHAGRTWGLAL